MSLLVKLWGYNVRQAHDGSAALDMAFVYRPDVLLLDIAMPKMHGYQLAQHLRQQAHFKSTLLIAITGYADEPHRLLGELIDHYLIKPVDPSIVEHLLQLEQGRLVERQRAYFANQHEQGMLAARGTLAAGYHSGAI